MLLEASLEPPDATQTDLRPRNPSGAQKNKPGIEIIDLTTNSPLRAEGELVEAPASGVQETLHTTLEVRNINREALALQSHPATIEERDEPIEGNEPSLPALSRAAEQEESNERPTKRVKIDRNSMKMENIQTEVQPKLHSTPSTNRRTPSNPHLPRRSKRLAQIKTADLSATKSRLKPPVAKTTHGIMQTEEEEFQRIIKRASPGRGRVVEASEHTEEETDQSERDVDQDTGLEDPDEPSTRDSEN